MPGTAKPDDKATDNGRTEEGTWEESVSRVWVGLQGGCPSGLPPHQAQHGPEVTGKL